MRKLSWQMGESRMAGSHMYYDCGAKLLCWPKLRTIPMYAKVMGVALSCMPRTIPMYKESFKLGFPSLNNELKYKASVIGLISALQVVLTGLCVQRDSYHQATL